MVTVTRVNSLAALEREWTGLVERAAFATPFHRPEWLIPWWERFGSGELHALAFRSDARLVGFLPVFLHDWLGRRQFTLVGNGVTDYPGLIAEPDVSPECSRLVFEYLAGTGAPWDLCDWRDLLAGSDLISAIPPGFDCRIEDDLPCTRIAFPASPEAYSDSLPHGLRRTIRLAARRLEREGELSFATLREDPDGGTLRALFRLHEDRWAAKGGAESRLDRPEVQRFLIDAARCFSPLGKLRLYTMSWRGELAAIICAFFDLGRTWGFINGMDPELGPFSPGSLVLHYAIREAIGEGSSHWEFLRGDEAYKFLWGAQILPKSRLLITARTLSPAGKSSPSTAR